MNSFGTLLFAETNKPTIKTLLLEISFYFYFMYWFPHDGIHLVAWLNDISISVLKTSKSRFQTICHTLLCCCDFCRLFFNKNGVKNNFIFHLNRFFDCFSKEIQSINCYVILLHSLNWSHTFFNDSDEMSIKWRVFFFQQENK